LGEHERRELAVPRRIADDEKFILFEALDLEPAPRAAGAIRAIISSRQPTSPRNYENELAAAGETPERASVNSR
jgi:hypothetical protein